MSYCVTLGSLSVSLVPRPLPSLGGGAWEQGYLSVCLVTTHSMHDKSLPGLSERCAASSSLSASNVD